MLYIGWEKGLQSFNAGASYQTGGPSEQEMAAAHQAAVTR